MTIPGTRAAPYAPFTTVAANADVDTWIPGTQRTTPNLPTFFANNAVCNVLDFGADRTGTVSCAPAVTKALAQRGITPTVLYFPAGRYLLPDYDFASSSALIVRGDPGLTTLTGGSRTVPNYTNPSLSGTVSRRIASFTGASGIVVEDVIFDGAQSTGPTYYAGSYLDVQALIEARSCSNVAFRRCTVVNFTPSIPAATSGGNPQPDPVEWMNQGPIYLKACDQVEVSDLQLLTPCYGEGVCLINCTHYRVERMYSSAGQLSGTTYGTSTPLHCVGPSSQFGLIRDCHFYKSNGSSLEVGSGLGNIDVLSNTVDSGGGFNLALANVGYFGDYDLTGVGLRVNGNSFTNVIFNTNSKIPGINLGSRIDGGYQYQNVQVCDNVFDSVYACIAVRGCQDVTIARNRASRVYVSGSPTSAEGTGVSAIGCTGLSVKDNEMDCSQVAGGGTGSNRATTGILVYDSDDVDVSGNSATDCATNNFRLGTQDRYTIPFTNGGARLRDMLWNQVWLGTAYAITGATSAATMGVLGRIKTSGDWGAGTAAGLIYGFNKVGTFTPGGEDLTLNAVSAAAHATADASFASWFNRMVLHDNQSRTITTTTTPYFCQPVGTNAMIAQNMRQFNTHNGAYIDPLNVGVNAGDANVTLTEFSLRTVQFLTALTADRTVTIPASAVQNGEWFIVERGVTSAFNITVQTSTPTTVFVLPPYVKGYALLQYNQGWRCVMFSGADQPVAISTTAIPTAGTWTRGQFVFNASASSGAPMGWICSVAGTPGTWLPVALQAGAVADAAALVTTETAGATYTATEQSMLNHLKTDVTSIRTTLNSLLAARRTASEQA